MEGADSAQISEFKPLSDAKKRHLAVVNLVFATICLVGAWLIPMFTRDWHIKRWYAGLGAVGKVQLSFGLLNYEVYAECNILKTFCGDWQGELGVFSYFDLADRWCNLQQIFTHVIFRGCHPLHMLTLVSLATFVILCLALWCFIMGMGLVMLYFNGYASKKLYQWILGFYSMAPLLQFVAITMYVGMTFDMRRYLNFGVIDGYHFLKGIVGSSHIVTFSFSTIGCFFLCFVSTLPLLILLQCIGRDKTTWRNAEEEALLAEFDMYQERIAEDAGVPPGGFQQGYAGDGYAADYQQQGYAGDGYAAGGYQQGYGYPAQQGYAPQY